MKKTQVSGMAFIQTIRVYQVKLKRDEERKKRLLYTRTRESLVYPKEAGLVKLWRWGIMKGTNEKDEL
jgi:hypothetical protein